ncbi:hypothetical protein [Legionella longbeachae]|uniref:hypothetical protein n=1 Tax=Legionella longbeachae TaxID=450 RepID=UPI000A1C0269|nr:hypothetical protein [Legionella longbeachae]ARM33691.1 hypothetical protein B0B39_09200 [Legionella longbeachae]HBD7397320.1 hypothetical protein [Legionella pneumophila]
MLKKDAQFIKNELELDRLYALKERSDAENYQIISFCVMNIRTLEKYPLINCDDDTQLELLTLRGDYYLSLFKTLSEIKNPTKEDISDRLKYGEIAYEYHPEDVKKIEQEFQLTEAKLNLDEDFSLALYLNELERKGEPTEKLEQKETHCEGQEQNEILIVEPEHEEKHPPQELERNGTRLEEQEQNDDLDELERNEEIVLIDSSQEKAVHSNKVSPLKQEDIKKNYHNALFDWAKGLHPDVLERYINKIIDKKYTPLLPTFSFRQRTEPVKEYLRMSKNDRGDNRLAYILSSGSQEDGALNQLLVKGLTPLILRKQSIPGIALAIQNKSFAQNIVEITRDVVSFAKKDNRFTHTFSDMGNSLVYRAIYEWVDSLTEKSFQSLIKSSLKQYETKIWGGYWGSSKRIEVEGYLKENCNSKALAMIFMNNIEIPALNECLFTKIIEAIKKEFISGEYPKMHQDLKYKLIADFNLKEHKDFYLTNLRMHHETIAAAAKNSHSVALNNLV